MKFLTLTLAACLIACLAAGSGPARSAGAASADPPRQAQTTTQPTTQTFADVPPSNPFYTYAENLYADGVVSGYTGDGHTINPCTGQVEQAGLLYFRPCNNVTRGQNTKFEDNGRRRVSGSYPAPPGGYFGLFSALNSDTTDGIGVYGQGAFGVSGTSTTSGTASGAGGYFTNNGGGTGGQYGVFAMTAHGTAGAFTNNGTGGTENFQYGVFAQNNSTTQGAGAAIVGQGMGNSAGAVFAGAGASLNLVQTDGIDVSGGGTGGYAIYSPAPSGDSRYTLYGLAHIHGTNVSAGAYEQEAIYDGVAPLPLGRVVALDPVNVTGGPLGVVAADPANAEAAIGVVSYRLVMNHEQGSLIQPGGTAQVTTVSRPTIDATATAVQPGDHIYITFAGRVRMNLAAPLKVGTRLAVGQDGTAVAAAAASDGLDLTFGKVAGQPLPNGDVDVLVSFK